MTEIGKRTCEELSPAEPVAKKTTGPDSEEATPLDKPNAKTSTLVNFILSVPVGDDEVREIVVGFRSEDVAFEQADKMFDDMVEFIDAILDKKYGDGVHLDDTSVEIVKRTDEKADGIWE